MIISKITRQKQIEDRYNIFTVKNGNEQYAFSVDEAILIQYQLRKGLELDSLLLSEIQFNDEIRKGYHLAVKYLAKVKRTEAEVRTYLQTKVEGDFIVSEVITKLIEMKFLDDEDYAFSYVRTQKNTTDKGLQVIKRELKEKGIAAHFIEAALKEISYDDQLSAAAKIAKKVIGSNKKESNRILLQKVEQTLMRKGHTADIIQEVKNEPSLMEETSDEMDMLRVQGDKAQRKFSKYTGYEFKQKMKQYLYRKGFAMEQIELYLDELSN
ncbi:recombination regulator RecX [Niallia sp. 01092]|uniref:recombination regulator RecX n=1 Tax=unclassified Niallia TaxID=2837522 RepID=UPI003FD1E7CF